jgi:LPXTG-motif cell wall-anchored protein
MKLSKIILGFGLLLVATNAVASSKIIIYYSPTCPHCHHARDFVNKTLVPEYGDDLTVTEINVTESGNGAKFMDAVKKCDMQGGYVPLVIVNGKCFQGFADAMAVDYRVALGAAPVEVKTEKADVAQQETAAAQLPEEQIPAPAAKSNTSTMLYILLGLLAVALGFVVFSKKKKLN